ncbi:MAG: phosphodiester glycosidase family protein, partial [Anaerolineales bacterium]
YIAYIVVVDLNKRNIDLMVTPEEGLGQTTSQFLESYGLQLAVNGDGWVTKNDPIGFAASEGEVYSEDSQEPTIYISKNGIVKIGGNPPERKIWHAISGSHTLVRNGRLDEKIRTCALPEVYCQDLAPRTSIGLSAGNYLIIVLVEGPPSEPREALTLEELANLHLQLGSIDAIAMDGGGSTTLVVDHGGVPQILNNPTDGTERVIANHLGIFVRNRADGD